jgi:hypothetical protein
MRDIDLSGLNTYSTLGSVSIRDTTNKTGPFCNLKGDTYADNAPDFGTLTVTDTFGIDPVTAFKFVACGDGS